MTPIEAGTLPATTVPVWVSRAGAVCLAAGVLGAVSGIVLASIHRWAWGCERVVK